MAKRTKLGDKNVRHDRFHQAAKRDGFRARAVFKLQEIDEQFQIFAPGMRVLDLGCAPGSWLQYARTRIGDRGAMVGLDRALLKTPIPGARLMAGDVLTISADELRGDLPAFDVVMSDMAPDTTGIRHLDQARSEVLFERALDIAKEVLVPGGHFIGKLFQGPEFQRMLQRLRSEYATAKSVKPESSRQISIEQYLVGKGKK